MFNMDCNASAKSHIPVMKNEVLDVLSPCAGEVYIDGTFGAGGYTRTLLEFTDCTVIAIDRDPSVLSVADEMQREFGDRFIFIQGCFGDMASLVHEQGFETVDGIVLDIGVSSMQIDEASRGFSFMRDGPLDMRMGQDGVSAEDVVNEYDFVDIARIIAVYGEEKKARLIARSIVKQREVKRITTTEELAGLIESVVGRNMKSKGRFIHPATRTFQALRIYVNDELGELLRGLQAGEVILSEKGRFVVVSFHSLEDRLVKKFFLPRTGRLGRPSRYLPEQVEVAPNFKDIFKGVKKASEEEVSQNPRSRSAKLRAVYRSIGDTNYDDESLLPRLNLQSYVKNKEVLL